MLFQLHKAQLANELREAVEIFVRYINLIIPQDQKDADSYHRELADEFHNSQVRTVTFIAYMGRAPQVRSALRSHLLARLFSSQELLWSMRIG